MKRNKEEGIPDEVRQHWAPDEPTLEGPPPEEIISEFGAGVLDRVYRVLRSFRLDRYQLAGPPVEVKADTLVRLKPESAQELLTAKRVIPVDLAEQFKVKRPFSVVGEDGFYINFERDDIVRMNETEALEHLSKGEVEEVR